MLYLRARDDDLQPSKPCVLTSIGCFIYDFQTLLVGAAAIVVAIVAGIPVWRQLKDTNLQTRISHRETLAALLRDALQRYGRSRNRLRTAVRGEPRPATQLVSQSRSKQEDANELENMLHGVLDWYLIALKDTEHNDIEAYKTTLKAALDRLAKILGDAHWADHNEQQDEDHDIPDDEWARIVCAQAKIDTSERVTEVTAAYRGLPEARRQSIQSLRSQIARLDLQIASPE